jgi:hypothetical protein
VTKPQVFILIFLLTLLLSLTVLTACTMNTAPATATPTVTVSGIDAQALLSQQCSRCHPLSRVTTKSKSAQQWKITVDRMIKHGAKLTASEEQALVDYLAANYQ